MVSMKIKKCQIFSILFKYCTASMVVPTQVHGADSPIFLEQLDCDATDSDLLQCNRFSAKGIHSCTHAQDVSVRCTGEKLWCTLK